MKDKLLSFETERAQLKYNVKEENFFMLNSIAAPELDEDGGEERQPVDLVCVIDRSGSMAGSRMKLTKEALGFLVEEMQAKDRLSIVLFDSDVDVYYPLTEMTPSHKEEVKKSISEIKAQGQTCLSGGLYAGLEELRKREKKNQISSILLFTDGEANISLTDSHSIMAMLRGGVVHPEIHIRRGKEKESLLQTYLRRKKQKKNQKPQQQQVMKKKPMKKKPKPVRPTPPVMSRTEMPMRPTPPVMNMRQMPMPPVNMSRIECINPNPAPAPVPQPPMNYGRSEMVHMPPQPIQPNPFLPVGPPMPCSPPTNINIPVVPPPVFPSEVVEGAYNYLQEGITVSTFGFGNSHNERLLKDIAKSSGGLYYFIKTIEDIAESFVDCLGGLFSIVCKNLRIEFRPVNGVVIKKVHTVYEKQPLENGGVAVILPDLQSEEKRDILLSCELPNLSEPQLRWKCMNVVLTYLDKDEKLKEEELVGVVMRVEEEPVEAQQTNEKISEQKNRVLVTEVMDEVRQLADEKRFDGARRKCKEVIQKVEQSPSGRNEFCQALVRDLNEQMSGLTTTNYVQQGWRKKMVCQQQGLQMQRVADVQSASNSMFQNRKRRALKSKFRGKGKF